jgi:hypothetical protein
VSKVVAKGSLWAARTELKREWMLDELLVVAMVEYLAYD